MSEILGLTAAQAAERVHAGDLERGELWRFYRDRALADDLNAFTWVCEGDDPEAIDVSGPLGGVPIGIKDLFATKGVPSQAGSKILEGYRPPYTATAVERLIKAGAPVLAKTNQDEFAMGSSTENSAYGPTLNPWDRARVPGGSSGGSAAAVAAGTVPWSIGTDTGGSIRQPAALCGIVGLKPTYGAISRYGMIAFASSLDQAGPFTRDTTDAALLLAAMAGQGPLRLDVARPARAGPRADRDRPEAASASACPEELTGEGIEPGVLAAFNETLDLARELGATVETMQLPHAPHGLAAYYLIAPAECSSNLARYDGVRYGMRADGKDLLSMYTQTREQGFGNEVKRRVLIGTYALSSGYYDAYYGRAQKVRTLIANDFKQAWDEFDFVVSPTAPGVAFELGAKTADPLAMYLNDYCTVPMSLAGIPAISIPNGLRRRAAGRLPDRRPGVQREPHPRRGARARAGDRLRLGASAYA